MARPSKEESLVNTLTNRKVVKALARPGSSFDRSGLLNEIYEALGREKQKDGQAALAEIMVNELCNAKTGAISRQRILDSICRLVNWHSDDVRTTAVEEMSEEELLGAVASAIPQLRVLTSYPAHTPAGRRAYRERKAAEALAAQEAQAAAAEEFQEIPEDEPHEPFN
jgi:hypothetical protein